VNFSGISTGSPIGRLLRSALRLLPPDTRVPILQGPLRGKRWIVGSGTHGCWLGSYEESKQRSFAREVRTGSVVFDVGAHVGFYTLLAAVLCGRTGRVVAIEPLPRNIAYLREHLRMNGIGNVDVIEAAASDVGGELTFGEGANNSTGRLHPAGSRRVASITLDALVLGGRVPGPHLIKMDIEGGEAAALRGARGILQAHRPTIFLATHGADVHKECRSILETAGYEVRALRGSDIDSTDELIAIHPLTGERASRPLR